MGILTFIISNYFFHLFLGNGLDLELFFPDKFHRKRKHISANVEK